MYVNCAAVLWLFGYMLLEVHRSWRSPCDAPLHTFVLGVAALGVAIALCDFIADVFKGARQHTRPPMPARARPLVSTRPLASTCHGVADTQIQSFA